MLLEEFIFFFSMRIHIGGLPSVLNKDLAFLSNSYWLQNSLMLKFLFLINLMLPSHLLCRCLFPPSQLHEDSQI